MEYFQLWTVVFDLISKINNSAWVNSTPEENLRWNSVMHYPTISELKKEELMREYNFHPNAFFFSRHFDPEKVLVRIEKVRFQFPVSIRSNRWKFFSVHPGNAQRSDWPRWTLSTKKILEYFPIQVGFEIL